MKYAIAYYSQTGTTETAAKRLGQVLGVTPVKIEPVKTYTADDVNWNNKQSRSTREQNDESARPEIKKTNLPDFDVLFLGYPTWWGVPPRLIDSFIEQTDLKGKTVVPFTTSGSSGPEQGAARVKQLASGAKVKAGQRVNGYSVAQLQSWVKSLNL